MTRLRKTAVATAVVLVAALAPLVGAGLVGAETNEGSTPTTQDAERRLTGGGLHTCAVLDTGEVQCWGQNDNGQLGNDSVAATTVPRKVVGITTALGVTGGSTHTCALLYGGTVRCWGNDGSGQLGNGFESPPVPLVDTPVTVSNLSDATAVAAGGFHTCAVRAGGTVVCWGHDGSGQLGDGGALHTSDVPVTVQVDTDPNPAVEALAPLNGATAVTSGEYHSCALIGATGEVKCWGHNGFGQLGNGITLPGTHSTTAVAVSGIPDDDPHKAVAITAGEAHTCAVLDDNTVRCWGQAFYGQLGNNTSGDGNDSSTPVKVKMDLDGDPLLTPGDVDDLTSVVAITAGQFHTCVLRTGGSVRCWGQNGRGQLGDNSTTDRKVAFPVGGTGVVRAVTAGGFHTCALVGTAMKCWGYNFYGQLGAYESANHTPVAVSALAAATIVTTGDGHACSLVTSTEVPPGDQPACWGNNASGELGADLTPSPGDTTIPVDVAGIADVGAVGVDTLLDPPVDPTPALSAGNQFACLLPAGSSTPKCWGRGVNGELGNGANASNDAPVAVSGLSSVTQVAAGGELDPVTSLETAHACARRSDGSVRCWGSNGYGQLGNESTTGSNLPVTVRSDHDDDHLNTPPPDLTAPVDLTGATAVAAGGRHSCALMSDTTVRCWGRNFDGQLGDGTNGDRAYAVTVDTDPDEPEPDESDKHFSPLTGVVEITAGARHTCARKSDHTVWCWGRGTSGQLGRNSTASSNVPVQVHNIGASLQPVQITAGDFHTCARVKEPRPPGSGHTFARCWGDNAYGQVGDGTTTNRLQPVAPSRLDEPGESSNIEVVKSISAGRKNTCAAIIETSVWCWGDNQFGQIGDGVGPLAKTPVDVDNLSSVGGNSIPAPLDDAATTAESTPVNVAVLANDTDADGTVLTVKATFPDPPNRGTVTTDGTTVQYTPNANFCTVDPTSNVDTFDYAVTDGTATVPATVTITVTCPNTAPDANDDAATTAEESMVTIDVLANDADINGQAMTVSSASDPANGTTVIEGNKVKYTPDANFFGTDTFTYTASDGIADSAPATVTVTVTNVNDPPVANDDAASTAEDTAVTIDVIGNDTDIDSPSLAVGSVEGPAHGLAVATSPTQVKYTPHAGYCGSDGFTYYVSDGEATDAGQVVITVTCTNDGPNAVDDSATTTEDVAVTVNVLANDTDPEGDTLTVTTVTDPPHGTAVNNGTDITYTPDPDFCGADDFGYTVSDGSASDSAVVVPVIVVCHNDPPVANDDTATTAEDTSVGVAVLANDTDPDFNELAVVSASDPAHGTSSVATTNIVSYTPDADYCGDDTFTYTVSDNYGGTDTATVNVTVDCVNDAPVVVPVGAQSLPWGETLTVPLSATDVDAGDSATFSLVSGPAGASVAGSSFTWTPGKLQVGTHTVVVRGTDGGGASDDESFTVTVGKRSTVVAYGGATSGQFSDPVGASATLLDFEGNPVGGVVVGFTIGTRNGAGMTDPGTGVATSTIVLDGPMGAGTVQTSFAGDDAYLPSSDSDTFTIDKELATTTFTGKHLTTSSGTSAAVQLSASVAEEADGSLGMGSATLQVTFSQVGGSVLCSAPVSGTTPGNGTATCTTSALGLGSRAVVAKLTSAKFQGPAEVGAFAIAQTPSGSAAGGGRVGTDDFAFQARPARKAPPAGDAVHVRRSGGVAVVNVTSTLTSLSAGCAGGKTKVCSTMVDGSSAVRYEVDLATGSWTLLAGTSALHLEAVDAVEPDGTGADKYGVSIGSPDSYALATTAIAAGNVRVVP